MEKHFKLISSDQDRAIYLMFLFILLLAKANLVFKKEYSKRNFVRSFGFGNSKIILALL